MRYVLLLGVVSLMMAGCGGHKSSLLLERPMFGPIEEAASVASAIGWELSPTPQMQEHDGIEIFVNYASPSYLRQLFSNKALFGNYAGKTPYFAEHMVFYVKVANRRKEKIHIDPSAFVLVDDRGSQYKTIGWDYITAFADSRSPVGTATRGLLSDARPGYFGVSVPIGRAFGSKSQQPYALIQQSSLQRGYMYPGVVHDGLIAFWSPNARAKRLTLHIVNLTSDFDASNLPHDATEAVFEFSTSPPNVPESPSS